MEEGIRTQQSIQAIFFQFLCQMEVSSVVKKSVLTGKDCHLTRIDVLFISIGTGWRNLPFKRN